MNFVVIEVSVWLFICLFIFYSELLLILSLGYVGLFVGDFTWFYKIDEGHWKELVVVGSSWGVVSVGIEWKWYWFLYSCIFLVENILYLLWAICKVIFCFIFFICSDSDDVLKTKTFGHSFYYPPIFLCFINGKKFFITSLIFTERWIFFLLHILCKIFYRSKRRATNLLSPAVFVSDPMLQGRPPVLQAVLLGVLLPLPVAEPALHLHLRDDVGLHHVDLQVLFALVENHASGAPGPSPDFYMSSGNEKQAFY